MIIRIAVVLPAPLAPTKPVICPDGTVEGHVVDGGVLAEPPGQLPDLQHDDDARRPHVATDPPRC